VHVLLLKLLVGLGLLVWWHFHHIWAQFNVVIWWCWFLNRKTLQQGRLVMKPVAQMSYDSNVPSASGMCCWFLWLHDCMHTPVATVAEWVVCPAAWTVIFSLVSWFIIGAMVIVWRVRGKIIRSVLWTSVQYYAQQLCTVQCTHIWTDLTVLWNGFCLTGSISLCLDSILYIYYCMHV